jgi:hypothetical protein
MEQLGHQVQQQHTMKQQVQQNVDINVKQIIIQKITELVVSQIRRVVHQQMEQQEHKHGIEAIGEIVQQQLVITDIHLAHEVVHLQTTK